MSEPSQKKCGYCLQVVDGDLETCPICSHLLPGHTIAEVEAAIGEIFPQSALSEFVLKLDKANLEIRELHKALHDARQETTAVTVKLETVTLGEVANLKAELKETNEALTNTFASNDRMVAKISSLEGQLEIDGDVIKTLGEEIAKKTHLLEWGWTIIANAGGGDWEKESGDWAKAAADWRDNVTPLIYQPKPVKE